MKTFELQNRDILICSEKGIFLSENEITNPKFGYLFDEEISKEDFSFLTISQYQESENYVIILYKKIIYIFNSEGNYITHANIYFFPGGSYYTLVLYKLDSEINEYYFIIGYINENQLLISLCSFNDNSGQISITNVINLIPKYQITNVVEGFSCQLMRKSDDEKVLTCFCRNSNDLLVSSYRLSDFSNIDELNYIINGVNANYVSSVISTDKSSTLICYLREYNYIKCDKYDINYNSATTIYPKHNENLICKNDNSLANMMYSSFYHENIFFGCFGYSNDFNIIKFDSDFELESEIINNQYIINNCDCATLDIIGSMDTDEYYLLASCQSGDIVVYGEIPDDDNEQKNIQINNEAYENLSPSNLEYFHKMNDKENTDINSETDINSVLFSNKGSDTEKIIDTINLNMESNKILNNSDFIIQKDYCSDEFLYQNSETNECLNSCNLEDLLANKCKINIVTNSNINSLTEDIRNIISKENITSETNIVIEGDNTIYQIISSTQMTSNAETNLSIIDLADCEKELLEQNHLDYLLILKIDTKIDEDTALILNYEVYNPLTNEKLNLSICNNMKIYTYSNYYPSDASITKIKQLSEYGYDLYNINDDFYQDICTQFTSDNGTDILLSDRKNDYFENVSLCENDCIYKGYDLNTKRVCCECPVKEEIIIDETGNKNIIKDFFDGSNFSNLRLLKCFKLVFSLKGQKGNIGSIIFICMIFILIILSIIYMADQEGYIIKNIRKINNQKYIEKNKMDNGNDNSKSKTKEEICFPPKRKKNKLNNERIKTKNKKVKIFDYTENNNHYSQNVLNSFSHSKKIERKIDETKKVIFKTEIDKDKKNELNYDIYDFSNEELNSLSYNLAIKYDKRTYFQYYVSLLKQKHLIIFTFFNNKDYNIFILKLSLFISSFALYFTVNAIFFTDDTMHDIYENNGSDIISQISNIFYSTIISCFINIIIKRLGLSYNDMVKIKQIPDEVRSMKESMILLRKLKIKFIIFFIVIFILISFFWYFISAFCAVYKNTQVTLIENTLSSYGLSLLYPLGLNLIPGIFRIPSLKSYSGCSKCIYFCSKLIALI